MDTASERPAGFLDRKLFWRITPALLLLAGILLLSSVLHFWNIDSIGTSNQYYTAAVESMTQSWHNFFFVAAEPGGSVTVDKPPLGLWIETLFALVLGVSGFSTSLPNILAGILSIPLLYHLVKKHLGSGPGLVAALVLAVTPVVFSTDRNNTSDGLLTFVLLLAAWAFLRATESGKLRHLLLGAFLVGLGFNIKMLQAFLPLPAFYALYFFASKNGWGRKLLQLGLATLLLVVVSLSWAVAVDLTPADQRPYIGSSGSNSVMSLIFGYNGMERLMGGSWNAIQNQANASDGANTGGLTQMDGTRYGQYDGNLLGNAPAGQDNGGAMFTQEVGVPGLLRFFGLPLGREMSWLLPFGLAGLLLALFAVRLRFPVESGLHKALLLWGGWLVTCLVFFSVAKFFHAYYMVMLVPALGGAVAIGIAALKNLRQAHPVLAASLLVVSALLTIILQVYLAITLDGVSLWLLLPIAAFAASAALILVEVLKQDRPAAVPTEANASAPNVRRGLARTGAIMLLLAMVIIPLAWSMLTVGSTRGFAGLPSAYAGSSAQNMPARPAGGPNANLAPNARPANLPPYLLPPLAGYQPGMEAPDGAQAPNTPGDALLANDAMVAFLQENTQGTKYLVAVPSSQIGAQLVIRTGRPVLYMGGFSGNDRVVDAQGLAKLVTDGDLRYVLYQHNPQRPGITAWLESNCTIVPGYGTATQRSSGNELTLYDCAAR